MLRSEIREILAEEQEVQRRKVAIDSLMCMRSKLLRESLEERMSRAQDNEEWSHLSRKECAGVHKEEKLYLKSQVDRLRHEQSRTKGMLAELRRLKARAILIRATQVASERKRH
ncbi:MAG TPA: hypothetical protein VJU54_10125 [Nitrospiraceae bacterium]|nr:hypothetical protein [Nitrospiraceae bacterium]